MPIARNLLFLIVLFSVNFARAVVKPHDSVYIHDLIREGVKIHPIDQHKEISLYQLALKYADSLNYQDDMVIAALVKVSDYLTYRGNVDLSMKYALKALGYYDQHGQKTKSIDMLIRIGDILRGNGFYDQGRIYFTMALKLLSGSTDSALYASVYNNIAANFFEDDQYSLDSSMIYAKKSLLIAQKLRLPDKVYSNLNILGAIETKRSNYPQAIDYFSKALPIALVTANGDDALILNNLAGIYKSLKQYKKSEELNLKAMNLALQYDIPQYLRLSCLNLYDLYKTTGDYTKALLYHEKYQKVNTQLLKQQVMISVQDFNYRIELDSKEDERKLLEKEQIVTKNRLQIVIILTILLSVILFLSITFVFYQQRQKKRKMQMIAMLDQSNNVLRKFISILAHDLRSPFNSILGFSEILKNDKELSEEDRSIIIDHLHSSGNSTFQLLERLLEWSRLESGMVKPNKQSCDVNRLISEIVSLVEASAKLKNISVEYVSGQSPVVNADQNMISAAIRNIVSNAVKFTMPGGKIGVYTTISNHDVVISIEDNGVGMTREQVEKLFRLEENYSSKGTAGEKGTGLGLILAKEYVEMNGGTLEVTSDPGKGSRFVVKLPLSVLKTK
ncbi:MAG: tetratricopeptide repeat-containing sensor histidine kinase [Bacteroidales bacterium]